MNEYNVLKVNIYGTDYPIKGNTNTEYIKKVAEYVDQKMHEVDQSVAVVSTLKVAILAALNIADELFKERTDKEEFAHQFEDKIRKLSLLLDEKLTSESEK